MLKFVMTGLIIFLFVMGTIWGSFLNVVIIRSGKGKSFVKGRSQCDKCKHQLAWKDNIPLLSFLLLGGRCVYCHKKISIMNPVMELLTGIFFVWWFLVGFGFFRLAGSPWSLIQPVFWLVVGLVFIVIFVVDLLYMIIPFWLNLFLFSFVLIYKILLLSSGNLLRLDFFLALVSGMGLALFLVAANAITKKVKGVDGFGLGDIYLAPSLGLILGWPKILPAIMSSFVIGSIVGIGLLVRRSKKMGDYLPFGPFLILGTVLGLLYGQTVWNYYLSLLV
jgi:prepilin signal peptidase PulO-like enzyme (type II secretory pathway)